MPPSARRSDPGFTATLPLGYDEPRAHTAVLFSGGMDSWMLWRLWTHDNPGEDTPPILLYVTLGHAYESMELATVAALSAEWQSRTYAPLPTVFANRLTLGDLEDPYTGHIPIRNLMLTAVAALYADVVLLGAVAGESSRDKSGRFFRDASRLLSFSETREVTVLAPIRGLTKTALVRRYLKLFPSELDLLLTTRSCYTLAATWPQALRTVVGCGTCMACFRRWVAMSNNGIHEPYLHHPAQWDRIQPEPANVRAWLRGIPDVPVAEWAALVRNNVTAARALRSYRRSAIR